MTRHESDIFNFLKEIAMEDGIMNVDETKIISHAMRTTISFDWYLEEAKKDGIIDDDEKAKLEELRMKIYDEAKSIAEKDDIITKEESRLLSKLADKLNEYSKYENL